MKWAGRVMVLLWFAGIAVASPALGQPRFPPPDFESGYKIPVLPNPPPRAVLLEYLDVAVLAATLGLACYFVYRQRSRRGVFALSLFSLAYFGFYRKGCICAIGSVQNVALSLFNDGYALPLTVLAFFVLPIVVSLLAGRTFCAAVCPHGALQDLVLIKPAAVPAWLEQGLALLPFIYLGAGVAFAATGSAFVICRYDPFVPLFRRSGTWPMLGMGAALLALGTVVGRPYCRFLCPYGAILKMAAKVSKWRVSITPDVCTQCRLCEESCPYGSIRRPIMPTMTPGSLLRDRRRLAGMLLLAPMLVLGGSWLGSRLSTAASQLNSTVALAERHVRQQERPVRFAAQTAAALSLARAEEEPKALLTGALEIRQRFRRAGWIFGAWVGLVIAAKLISLSVHRRYTEYEPDRAACLACARCFNYCPSERVRCGALRNHGVSSDALVEGGVLASGSQAIASAPAQSTN